MVTPSYIYNVKTSKVSFKPQQTTLAATWTLLILLSLVTNTAGLRCYVCGGSTGRECEDIVTRRWSPYVRPRPVLTSDGKRQWEECNDLINNKGCIKQVVNGGKNKTPEAAPTHPFIGISQKKLQLKRGCEHCF